MHGTSSETSGKKSKLKPWLIHFISGGIAGTAAKTAIAPLDRVKILFQTNNPHYPYTGLLKTLASIVNKEGFFSLWRGNSATVARVIPYAAVQFMSFEFYKKILHGANPHEAHPFLHLIAGSLAGMTSVCFTYPLDLMRARLASEVGPRRYKSLLHGIATMFRNEGFRAFFNGLNPSLQGIIPYAGVSFSVYETLKFYSPKSEQKKVQTKYRLLSGAIAGVLGQTVSYPWDVVRRRLQTEGFTNNNSALPSGGTFKAMKFIFLTEGFVGLYKGLTINFWKAPIATSISFTVYELCKIWFTGESTTYEK
eukprot:TRINITY_DN3027_c0_g1_i1.p1 TRINITY_DN3027_c0_g1~~TRINITY_DN3027_c0_g1_i1.p1  ORF type:complete len:308 (-),score=44.02 TRINITY_DN3027_c0_g1_i1:75-998(-)